MKTFKLLLLFVLSFGLFSFASCKPKVKPTLTVQEEELTLKVGEEKEIAYMVSDDFEVKFTVEDSEILQIENGKAKALKEGTTKIKLFLAKHKDVSATIAVTVTKEAEVEITVKGPKIVYIGDEAAVFVVEKGDLEGEIDWFVDLSSSVELPLEKDGNRVKIKGVKAGKVTLTCYVGDIFCEYEFEVKAMPKVEIVGTITELMEEEKYNLSGVLYNAEGELTWTSSDETVATVNEKGTVQGIKPGTVVITAAFNDFSDEYMLEIIRKPKVLIEGPQEVEELATCQLVASFTDLEGEKYEGAYTWESSNEDVAVVNKDTGFVTASAPGEVVITARYKIYHGEFTLKVTERSACLIYDFAGGVSRELYESVKPSGYLDITNYNYNEATFWSGAWTSYVFIGDLEHDPKAIFSDRYFIAKNPHNGYWEVLGMGINGKGARLMDCPGGEWVITVSSSNTNYNGYHNQCIDVQVGDFLFFDDDFTTAAGNHAVNVKFYNPKVDVYKLVVMPDEYKGSLIEPTRLGYKFLGWYDASGEKVPELASLTARYILTAKWEALNPVTDIVYNDVPATMVKGDTFKIDAKVAPDDAYFKDISFATSDKTIIEVDRDGNLKVMNAGKATISITDYIGLVTKTIEIDVYPVDSLDVTLPKDFSGLMAVDEELQLEPSYFGKPVASEIKYTYTSSNTSVATVDDGGKVKAVSDGATTITVKANTDPELELAVDIRVGELSDEDKLDKVIKLIVENHFPTVEVGNMSMYNDGRNRYYLPVYGNVNRMFFDKLEFDRTVEDVARNNPNNHKSRRPGIDDVQFVTVHDTATITAPATNIVRNMSGGETSIHYCVGEFGVCTCVPEEFIAYHAADGTSYDFIWTNTQVKAKDDAKPEMDLKKVGNKYMLVINGEDTVIEVPTEGTKTIESPTKDYFCDLGPVYTIKDGYYYVGPLWACFKEQIRGAICSRGGNNNSIGIEMSVNVKEADNTKIGQNNMYDTFMRTSRLVADIMVRYNLGMERVQFHNSWSGKNCPQTMRAGSYQDDFLKMVEVQYTMAKDYPDVEVSFTSNNTEIVNEIGCVVKFPVKTTSVSYTVKVKSGDAEKTITLASIIPGTSTWEQWLGSYPTAKVWNNGNFAK